MANIEQNYGDSVVPVAPSLTQKASREALLLLLIP
jgi:hypothetical protein